MIKAVTAWLVLAVKFLPREIRAAFLIMGVEAAGRSMLSPRRLISLYFHCSDPMLPQGCFVECGVARGGSLAIMSFASAGKRSVWGFDSFEGMPQLTEEDKSDGEEWVGYRCSGPDGLREAQRTLKSFHAAGDWVKLVRGWFEDTLPPAVAGLAPIAVLRLDNDWYESTPSVWKRFMQAWPRAGWSLSTITIRSSVAKRPSMSFDKNAESPVR